MPPVTHLSPTATPGQTYSFSPKASSDIGGYNLYRAATRSALLNDAAIAFSQAGTGEFQIAHADDTAWWYGITTVSSAGVENTDEMRVLYQAVASGVLAGPLPNAITWARTRPIDAGQIELTFEYDAGGQAGVATGIQVFRATGPGGAGADYDSPLETVTISGSTSRKVTLAASYDHGETVWLVLRAVTDAGDQGPVCIPENPMVVADADGPEANTYLVASQG